MNNLAEDILVVVLCLIADDPRNVQTRARAIRACSQVCKSWRIITLHCSRIWAGIINYKSDSIIWMKELITRSGTSPLDITTDERLGRLRIRDRARLNLLLKHTARWRHVHIETTLKCWDQLEDGFLLQPAPKVETLTLSYPISSRCPTSKKILFAHHAPNLRSLTLYNVALNFAPQNTIFRGLDELNVSLHGSQSLYIDQWLRFLQNTPRLRYLYLRGAIYNTKLKSPIPVILDHLELLCLEDTQQTCRAVVENLVITPKCGLMLHCKEIMPSLNIMPRPDLLSFIKSAIQRPVSWRLDIPHRSLHADYSEICIGSLDSSKVHCSFSDVFNDMKSGDLSLPVDNPLLYIRFEPIRGSSDDIRSTIFSALFTSFEAAFPKTTFLKLWADENSLQGVLAGLYQLNSVESLSIFRESCDSLFPLLCQTNPLTGSVILPSLKVIHLNPGHFFEHLEPSNLENLKRFLIWRRDQGHPIPTISVFDTLNTLVTQNFLGTDFPNVSIKKSEQGALRRHSFNSGTPSHWEAHPAKLYLNPWMDGEAPRIDFNFDLS